MRHRVAITLRHSGEREPIPIVSDAAIMSKGVADGRLLPLLILDTSARPDLDDVVQAHQEPDVTGDVEASWVKQSWRDRSQLRLLLEFLRPIPCVVIIAFKLSQYAGFIDQIVQNEGLYIQPGRPGDRLKNTWDSPRMVLEVNCESFRQHWEPMFLREAAKKLHRNGMTASSARKAAPEFVREWRAFTTKQMAEYETTGRDPSIRPN